MKIYGLTGGIASGKSSVGNLFKKIGVPVIDADEIARTLRLPNGEAHIPLMKRFGTTDGKALRQIIANNSQAKKDIESIMHPLIEKVSQSEFEKHKNKNPFIIYEGALLVESGRYKKLDGLITVVCEDDFRLMRLMERDGMSIESARQFISAQGDISMHEQNATHVIYNDGTYEDLEAKVHKLHQELLKQG